MEETLARAYGQTQVRVGDVAWRARYHTHSHLSLEIRLWDVGGELVGWTWVRTRGGFDVFLTPERRGDTGLVDEMLDTVETVIHARLAAGDELPYVYTFFLSDDAAMADALRRRGFEDAREPGGHVLRRELDSLPQPVVPDGYRLGWVVDDHDLLGRVEAHWAAFAPSDLTAAMYERVRRTWSYRQELDRIAVADDGQVVAFCTAWLDERNHAGLLEPVGTHPAHQRRGLASAVVVDALGALRDAGATVAQIGTSGETALATYSSIGFRPWKREVTFRKEL
jgi:ribosomal protein S18 acetylase RimI-like enzyme